MNGSDKEHCRCFQTQQSDIEKCKGGLEDLGFRLPIAQENHGQVFGLTLKLEELLQLHFKVMPDGLIESEIEPPASYPIAHLDHVNCFAAHQATRNLLNDLGIHYKTNTPVPITCIRPKTKKPDNPIHVNTIILGTLIAFGVVGVLVNGWHKSKKN